MKSGIRVTYKEIDVVPCPAPRQCRRDAHSPSPSVQRYRAFKDELVFKTNGMQLGDKLRDAVFIQLNFFLPAPKKRKQDQQPFAPHTQKPDLDNLMKAFFDALLPDSDSCIHDVRARKVWAQGRGGMTIEIHEMIAEEGGTK